MSNRQFFLCLSGYFGVLLAPAASLPIMDDELYYWCWSRDLQPSYFDHPPMIAYFIRLSTLIFGDSTLAIRLPGCLASTVVLGVLGQLCRPRTIIAWIAATPVFLPGAVLVTPDTPLLLFWALYLYWLTRTLEKLDDPAVTVTGLWWLLGGLILGCGALSKYTSVLMVPAGFVAFVYSARTWRNWWAGYLGHGVFAGLCTLPVVYFNFIHDFAPLRFQWEHANSHGSNPAATFGQFVGVQLLLVGVMPFSILVWSIANGRTLMANAATRAAGCLFVVPFAIFLVKATRGPLEGNWALAAYLGCWPLATRWAAIPRPRWMMFGAFAMPLASTVVLLLHVIVPLAVIPPKHDRVTRQFVRLEAAKTAAERIREYPEQLPIYTPTYQWVSMFRYRGIPARQLPADVSRPSHFTQEPDELKNIDRMLVWNEGPLHPDWAPEFGLPELIETYPIVVRGETITYFHLLLYKRVTLSQADSERRVAENPPGNRPVP